MDRDMLAPVQIDELLNAEQPWDSFDSVWYLSHNYDTLRYDDRRIIEWMSEFFARAPRRAGSDHGVDVGSGTNLYPALAMLPRCHQITLVERASTNVQWLKAAVDHYPESWDPFWRTMVATRSDTYGGIDSRRALESRAEVVQGNIFDLPPHTYDVGTMFFVAESITGSVPEFEKATKRFVGSLHRRAPFAAAFMKNSRGYQVGSYRFPAVAVDDNDVLECLRSVAHDVEVHVVSDGVNPLRDGYDGMILATGFAGKK
jgi:hypothetical protein